MNHPSDFWDALAPRHAMIENSYFDLSSLRRIAPEVRSPALVVGAGQGLIVEGLRKRGVLCDGVDLSAEMVRYARLRRGLDLIQADARSLPFGGSTYRTVLIATGVVDFMADEEEIRKTLSEARRVVCSPGKVLVAFYKLSAATENVLTRLELLRDDVLRYRETLEIYRLNPVHAMEWVVKRAKVGRVQAAMLLLRSALFSTWQEKRNAFHMRKILAVPSDADALLRATPEEQPYRNAAAIRGLFVRLALPIRQLAVGSNCSVAEI